MSRMIIDTIVEPILPSRQGWNLYDVPSTRQIEQIAQNSAPPHALMLAAGLAVARLATAVAPHAQRIWVAAGPGNNGGDGLVAARLLHAAGRQVEVSWLGDIDRAPTDALQALCEARSAGVKVHSSLPDRGAMDLCIDALLGLGSVFRADGALADCLATINAMDCPVVAVDIPSGLDGDTGQTWGDLAVRADHTLSLLTLKPGLFTGRGRDHSGKVWLCTLGVMPPTIPPTALLNAPSKRQQRCHADHKGSFGDVLVLGGARGMVGAAWLAARAALTAGAGRVYAAQFDPESALDGGRPEVMWREPKHLLAPDALGKSTVVCGCGGGQAIQVMLPTVLHHAARLVLDADALNLIASDVVLRKLLQHRQGRGLPTILTPHPLEAARLLHTTTHQIQTNRLKQARALASELACTVLLKGSGSVIAQEGRLPVINSTGSARLATAGTGDVLAGWLAGLWAQRPNHDPFELTCSAAWEHGAAANRTPDSSRPLRAADLIECLANSGDC